jgi:hypothetical protein
MGVPIAMGVKAKQGRQRPGTVTRAMVKSSSLHFLFTDVAQLCCIAGGLAGFSSVWLRET